MNRGFAFYFKNAMKSSAEAIWKNKSMLSVLAYFLSAFVARITILFSAVFDLADIRQAKIVDENKRFNIPDTFKVATKHKPVWTMVLSIIAEAFIFLGGALLIAILTAILGGIGYVVYYLIGGPLYIVYLFCIPGGLLLIVYAVIMCLIFSPTPYIIETNPGLGVNETLRICFDTMKGNGKGTAFLNFFIPTLIELLVIGFCGGIGWVFYTFLKGYFLPIILVAWGIISILLIVAILPMFDLARKVAQKNLFEDIVLDPINANKRTAGINIKMCKGVKFAPSAVEDNLVALFNQTNSDSVPAPNSPARKKVKENAERAAKNREEQQAQAAQTQNKQVNAQPPAQQAKPAETEEPAKTENTEVAEPQPESVEETVSSESDKKVPEPIDFAKLSDMEPAKATGGESEEFDLDQFATQDFDLDKFIDAQVAEAQFMQPAPEQPAEAIPEEPAAEVPKPRRTRTTKPKTEQPAEEGSETPKPRRTRTTKPKTEQPAEASSEEPTAE